MKNPNIKTKVVHSQSKDDAWNVVCTTPAGKHKVARIPYQIIQDPEYIEINELYRKEAFEHATFISECFNNSDLIINSLQQSKKYIVYIFSDDKKRQVTQYHVEATSQEIAIEQTKKACDFPMRIAGIGFYCGTEWVNKKLI